MVRHSKLLLALSTTSFSALKTTVLGRCPTMAAFCVSPSITSYAATRPAHSLAVRHTPILSGHHSSHVQSSKVWNIVLFISWHRAVLFSSNADCEQYCQSKQVTGSVWRSDLISRGSKATSTSTPLRDIPAVSASTLGKYLRCMGMHRSCGEAPCQCLEATCYRFLDLRTRNSLPRKSKLERCPLPSGRHLLWDGKSLGS